MAEVGNNLRIDLWTLVGAVGEPPDEFTDVNLDGLDRFWGPEPPFQPSRQS